MFAVIEREVRELWRDGKGPSLVAIASGWGILLGTRMVYPVLLPYFRASFGFSLTAAGLLVTVLWLGSAVGQLPGGVLADRYNERLVMVVGAVVGAVAVLFVVTATTPVVLFAATGVLGLGQSLYPIARITILSDIYPNRLGRALGVTMATGDLGQAVLPPVVATVAVALGWQAGLSFVVPLLVVVAVAIWVTLPAQAPSASAVDALSRQSLRNVLAQLRRPTMLFVAVILFLYILAWQSFTGFYPTYLVEVKGLSPSSSGLLFSGFFAFGVVVKPLVGGAYDRIGMRRALVLVLVGPVVGLGLLPVVEGFWPLVAVTALVSTMLGSGVVTQSFLSDTLPDDVQGTGLGAIRTLTATLGALGPVFFGAIAGRGYFDEGYVLLAAILGGVILLTLRLPDTPTDPDSCG